MCFMFKSLGVLAIIPATVLLAFSFFVLFAISKLNAGGLKAFGKIIAALLWVCALLVVLTAICPGFRGRCSMDKMEIHKMMKHHMDSHMMQGQESGEMMAQ